jgi:branched-chain amino acid transport system ATP-binding protein
MSICLSDAKAKVGSSNVEPAATARRDILSIERITAGYGQKQILRDVTVAVRAGEVLAVVGPNGAGKSTLLKVAMGLLQPWEGRVVLEGRDITSLSAHERADAGVGMLLQRGAVFPSLSVRENFDVSIGELPPERRPGVLDRLMTQFPDLPPLLDRRAGLLSGGQRQRLALAMVVARSPKVLLLDEPSAGLAPALAGQIFASIRDLARSLDAAVVLIEQNLRPALVMADRAVALAEGRVALETQTPRTWLEDGQLEALFWGDRTKPDQL